jgi:beta-ureidopropionase / N-carbamoyl-L-amino-acid hydrolase
MPTINPERLLDMLKTLRTFGAVGTGVVRPSLSPVDMEARRWLRGRMFEAGLDAWIDGVGNVIGQSRNRGKALLIGSHSDTQPKGGWLDGALGVIYGIEIVRAFAEDPATRALPVDAVAWVDEESTYLGCLGSRSFCGVLTQDAIAAATNAEGHRLSEAIKAAALEGIPSARLEPERYVGYLEGHIEQGPYLEAEGNKIGVVASIVGIRGCRIYFRGQQNHAGTTPMPHRKDAGVALIDFAYTLRQAFQAIAGPKTVWTIGRVSFSPGAPSIIPGEADMILQYRDPSETLLDRFEQTVNALAATANRAGLVEVTAMSNRTPIKPTIMDAGLQQHIAAAAERHAPGAWVHMPSAAGHDPMVLSDHLPCAMLFVPSRGGISHDFAEDTDEADIVLGCQVLADTAASILGGAS